MEEINLLTANMMDAKYNMANYAIRNLRQGFRSLINQNQREKERN